MDDCCFLWIFRISLFVAVATLCSKTIGIAFLCNWKTDFFCCININMFQLFFDTELISEPHFFRDTYSCFSGKDVSHEMQKIKITLNILHRAKLALSLVIECESNSHLFYYNLSFRYKIYETLNFLFPHIKFNASKFT